MFASSRNNSFVVNSGTNQTDFVFQLSPTPAISSWNQDTQNGMEAGDLSRQPMNPQELADFLARKKMTMRRGNIENGNSAVIIGDTSGEFQRSDDSFTQHSSQRGRGRGRVILDQTQTDTSLPQQFADILKRMKRTRNDNRRPGLDSNGNVPVSANNPLSLLAVKKRMTPATFICDVYTEMGKRYPCIKIPDGLFQEVRNELGENFNKAGVNTVVDMMCERMNRRMRQEMGERKA